MRVFEIVHGFPPAATGGTEIYTESHAAALVRLFGDEVTVLAREADRTRPEYGLRTEERSGLRVVHLNHTFADLRDVAGTYTNPAIDAVAGRLLDEIAPDVAHVHHLTCLSTTLLNELERRNVPIVMTLHDYWLICHRGQLMDTALRRCAGPEPDGCRACYAPAEAAAGAYVGRSWLQGLVQIAPGALAARATGIARAMASGMGSTDGAQAASAARMRHMRQVCGMVSHFLAPSRYLRDRFIGFGVDASRITWSPYGVDHTRFVGRKPRLHPARPLRLGFLGSLMVSKGPAVLLEAFAGLPEGAATLDLYGTLTAYHGDDRLSRTLPPLLARPGITLHAPVPHERVGETLATLDLLVVPSVWAENSPFVIHEALLAGVPVLASNVGGIPELVEHGRNGLLVEAGDVPGLREALRGLVDDPSRVATLREACLPIRSLEDDVRGTRELYERMIRVRRAPARRPTPRVTAVVLNYETPEETRMAVQSLRASRRTLDHLIVVDNGTGERCPAPTLGLDADGEIVAAGSNRGFAAGMNVGIRKALAEGSDYVLLVNSDAIVPPDCVGLLVDALEARPRAGLAAPVLLARARPASIESLGLDVGPTTGRIRHAGHGERYLPERVADWTPRQAVSGCVLLIRRGVLERVGLLDEGFFLYYEDVDLCLRAHAAGFEAGLAGRAVAYHEGGASLDDGDPRRLYLAARAHLRLADKHFASHPIASPLRTAAIVTLNAAGALRRPGSRLRALTGVMRGAHDHFRQHRS